MEQCEFCDEEFEGEESLHIHWLEEHEDEINSHQKDQAKKAKREKEEREKVRKEQRKKYLYQGVGGAVLLVIIAIVGAQLMPSGGSSSISLEGEPMIGDSNASVTVVEFGDLQCPACSEFESGAYQQLKSEYIDTGQVKFYWKDFPLENIHPWARGAAETLECVQREDEDAFWNVKGTLFQNQGSLDTANAQGQVINWASEEGVNESNVQACLDSGDARSEVSSDIQEGRANGVTGTPTIFVNGEKLGSFDYQTIKSAIDSELEN